MAGPRETEHIIACGDGRGRQGIMHKNDTDPGPTALSTVPLEKVCGGDVGPSGARVSKGVCVCQCEPYELTTTKNQQRVHHHHQRERHWRRLPTTELIQILGLHVCACPCLRLARSLSLALSASNIGAVCASSWQGHRGGWLAAAAAGCMDRAGWLVAASWLFNVHATQLLLFRVSPDELN